MVVTAQEVYDAFSFRLARGEETITVPVKELVEVIGRVAAKMVIHHFNTRPPEVILKTQDQGGQTDG